jgi:hypothetical protein
LGADLINFPSYLAGCTFLDPSLQFPVNVSEWVEFKSIWQTIRMVSQGDKLIFAAVFKMSGPEF